MIRHLTIQSQVRSQTQTQMQTETQILTEILNGLPGARLLNDFPDPANK